MDKEKIVDVVMLKAYNGLQPNQYSQFSEKEAAELAQQGILQILTVDTKKK